MVSSSPDSSNGNIPDDESACSADETEQIVDLAMQSLNQGRAQRALDMRHILGKEERINRIRSLKGRTLIINPENPEDSPDLLQMERLYIANMVPNEAFVALKEKQIAEYALAVQRGGMLNVFHPTGPYADAYPEGYESVRDQIIADVLKKSKRPGNYHIIGLFDAEEILRSYVSIRLPPKKPSDPALFPEYQKELEAYALYIEASLFNENMRYITTPQEWDRERTRQEIPSVWELDTINVDRDWGRAGLMAIREVLHFIQSECEEFPQSVYCYRFEGLWYRDEESGKDKLTGINRASRAFFEDLGFDPMAFKIDEYERIPRILPDDEVYMFTPVWCYLHNSSKRTIYYLETQMKKQGLLELPLDTDDQTMIVS